MRLWISSTIVEELYGDPEWTRTTDLRLRRPYALVSETDLFHKYNGSLCNFSKKPFCDLFTHIYILLNQALGGKVGEDRLLGFLLTSSAQYRESLNPNQSNKQASLCGDIRGSAMSRQDRLATATCTRFFNRGNLA
jgi:hypothetical protein